MDADKAQAIERLHELPLAMRERRQWLLWRFVKKPDVEKLGKVPFYVSGRKRRGTQGSVEDRDELQTFDAALSEFKRGPWDGLGFAFLPDDGLIGVDIDGAVDPDTGEISERCKAIIAACASYTEWSPSRRGVHIICGGYTKTFKDNSIGLEVFCNAQFFTCTGERWDDQPAEVTPLADGTLKRLQATVRAARAAVAAPAQAKVQAPAIEASAPGDDFARVNAEAMRRLADWVPALLPAARYYEGTGAWRVSSKALNRDLQEDLSIAPDGIVDWGIADTDSRAGKRTPVDLVMEHLRLKAKESLVWLAARLGLTLAPRPAKPGKARGGNESGDGAAAASAGEGMSTPSSGSAGEDDRATFRSWRDDLFRARGGLADCRENVYLVLMHHPLLQGLVGYDEFAHRVIKQRPTPWGTEAGEWSTNDDYKLGFWLAKHQHLMIKSEATIVAGVAMAAQENSYHPVHDYLKGLPEWDGIERMPHWLHECLGAEDSNYTRLVGTWFLMGMVKRILQPGCQMDYMIVLEGLQGKQKSTALRTLVGNDDWFADTPIRIGDKDSLLSLAGKWLYEVGELDSFNKAEVTTVKQYVSSRIDRVREPFARRPCDRARSGVFAGSTNQSEYFKDPTGARRFWPVACDGTIDLAKLVEWRDQLFAEAQHRLQSEDADVRRYWPTLEETNQYLVPQQERREIVDPWFERLAVWVESKDIYSDTVDEIREVKNFTSQELLVKALFVSLDRIDGGRQMATRVGIAMHKLGWKKQRDATGARLWRYWRPDAVKAEAHGPATTAVRPAAGDGVPDELFDA